MINQIEIINFKSHKNTKLQIGNITILSGQNGVGKSSILQGLLLLRQSFLKHRLQDGLDLNKPLCSIGSAWDALCQYADSERIGFKIAYNKKEFEWIFEAKLSYMQSTSFLPLVNKDSINPKDLDFSLFTNQFQYIGVLRSSNYITDDYAVNHQKQISIEDGKCELAAQFLEIYRTQEVLNELMHKDQSSNELLDQVSAWEREISEGVKVIPKKNGINYDILYSFETKSGNTNTYNSKNVGFGLSYSLPIILSILASNKDSLIIIENPEAHIHPSGQAKLIELICIAASMGIQIILETHSDHIVNGALVSVKKGIIKPEQVQIYSFEREYDRHNTKITEVKVLSDGKIEKQPNGFFDQIEKDLDVLMGF